MATTRIFSRLFKKTSKLYLPRGHVVCINCLSYSLSIGRTLCSSCFSRFLQNNSWTGCARCGRHECASCEILSEFSSVTSLFRLDAASARILVQAKDYADAVSQWMIEDISSIYFAKEVQSILSQNQISHIIIAPLRRERVIRGSWHPSFLLEKACVSSGAKIIIPTIRGAERQASFSATEREKRSQKQHPELVYPTENILKRENVSGVLFVDDVITTGGSAQRARKILPTNFQNAPWHILTIFRSPRKFQNQ